MADLQGFINAKVGNANFGGAAYNNDDGAQLGVTAGVQLFDLDVGPVNYSQGLGSK